jgi:hypothetical protein
MGHANEPVQLGSGNLDPSRHITINRFLDECFGDDGLIETAIEYSWSERRLLRPTEYFPAG